MEKKSLQNNKEIEADFEKKLPYNEELQKISRDNTQKKAKGIIKHTGRFMSDSITQDVTLYTRGDKICLVLSGFEFVGDDWGTLAYLGDVSKKNIIRENNIIELNDMDLLTRFSITFSMNIKLKINDPVNIQKVSYIYRPLKFQIQVDQNDEKNTDIKNKLTLECFSAADAPKHLFANNYTSKIRQTINECLQDIKNSLPENIIMSCCWNCGWSYYSPYGQSQFGGLGCFKNITGWENRRNLIGIADKWEEKDNDVQEVYFCDSWVNRTVPQSMPNDPRVIKKKFDIGEVM